jgi:hypothetical protein
MAGGSKAWAIEAIPHMEKNNVYMNDESFKAMAQKRVQK